MLLALMRRNSKEIQKLWQKNCYNTYKLTDIVDDLRRQALNAIEATNSYGKPNNH